MNKYSSAIGAVGWSLIGLGTNMPFSGLSGAPLLEAALAHLADRGLPPLRVSQSRRTAAWPDPSDPPFTNAVAVLNTGSAAAQEVLAKLLAVERMFGRERGPRNAPRTLDLDLLDWHGGAVSEPGLEIPHPRLPERRFVLEPLAEIWPEWRHPVTGSTALELLAQVGA